MTTEELEVLKELLETQKRTNEILAKMSEKLDKINESIRHTASF